MEHLNQKINLKGYLLCLETADILLCLYFVGLSGSGKTTLACVLIEKIRKIIKGRKITYLDGDQIRQYLSKGLGFNKEDRSTNVRRIGYVASEVVKHDGIVVCANIAPYEEDRKSNRNLISGCGEYIEIFVDTALKKCEERDCKGLYKLARAGKIKQFTGINDPFEIPTNPEIIVDGSDCLDKNSNIILDFLSKKGLI